MLEETQTGRRGLSQQERVSSICILGIYIIYKFSKKDMADNFKSTKFVMALIGMALCVAWAVFKLDKEYLVLALSFTGVYSVSNVAQKFIK